MMTAFFIGLEGWFRDAGQEYAAYSNSLNIVNAIAKSAHKDNKAQKPPPFEKLLPLYDSLLKQKVPKEKKPKVYGPPPKEMRA